MKKIFKYIISLLFLAVALLGFGKQVLAANLTVDCPDNGPACSITPANTPLFEEPNIYPGYSVTRQITVNNHDTNEDCSLLLRAYNLRDLHNLAVVLPTSIVSGPTTYFSQTLDQLFNLPVPGTLSLGTVLAGGSKVYDWQITMSTGAGNEYQGVSTLFDFDLQFTCGTPSEAFLNIEKTNNKKGTILKAGDVVTYTITVSNDGGATVYDVVVKDVQPTPPYFTYNSGGTASLTCGGSSRGYTLSGSNPYLWEIGDIEAGQECVLTYYMTINNDSIAGTHHNMAVAYGQDSEEGGNTVYSGVVYDPFDIGQPGVSASYRGEVKSEQTGTVLGAATSKVGQVLGAATGSKTFWLIVSLLMIVLGGVILKHKKLAKIMKNLFLVLLIVLPLVNARVAKAQDNQPPVVKIVQLPEYTNKKDFEISYTALDAGEAGLRDVHLEFQKEGGGWQSLGTFTDHAAKFRLDGGKINEDKKYYFKATACDNNTNCASDETFTNVDTVPPPKPENYSKEKIGVQTYKIKWHNANSDDLYKVYVYRSDKKDYDANDSTKVTEVLVTKNTDSDWTDWVVPDSTKEWYYALRSFDKAGNASDLVGDTYTTVVITTTTTQEAPAGEEVTGQEVIVGQAPVAGVGVPGGEGAGAGEGQTLGKEAEAATSEAEFKPEEIKIEGETAGESFVERVKKFPWLVMVIIGLGLVGGYWFFRVRKE